MSRKRVASAWAQSGMCGGTPGSAPSGVKYSVGVDWLPAIVAGVAAAAFGWLAAGQQHRLYRELDFRQNPAGGRRLFAFRIGLGATAGVIAFLALRPDHYDAGPAVVAAAFAVLLAVLASTDFERKRIPNAVSYPAILAAAALCWVWPDRSIGDIWLGAGVAVGVAAVLTFGGLAVGLALRVRQAAFGLGDAKLIVLLGLLLGWPAILGGLFVGVIAAGVPALALMLLGRSRSIFSYGPFLALGGVVALLWPDRFV